MIAQKRMPNAFGVSGYTMGSRVRFETQIVVKHGVTLRLTTVYNADNGWYLRSVAEYVK